jgi:hypothetical protein
VHLVVDPEAVAVAAARVDEFAGGARLLAAALTSIPAMSDPRVRAGFTELADVCGDVLELVAIDLELVAASARTAGHLYSAVEAGLVAGSAFPGH